MTVSSAGVSQIRAWSLPPGRRDHDLFEELAADEVRRVVKFDRVVGRDLDLVLARLNREFDDVVASSTAVDLHLVEVVGLMAEALAPAKLQVWVGPPTTVSSPGRIVQLGHVIATAPLDDGSHDIRRQNLDTRPGERQTFGLTTAVSSSATR